MSTRRVAIVAEHGIGYHEPHSHAQAIANGLVGSLPIRGSGWRSVRSYLKVAPGTRIKELPAFAIRVECDDPDAPSFDIYEPSWAHRTKGLTSPRRLIGWLRAAIHYGSDAFRLSSRKTLIEQSLALVYLTAPILIVLALLVGAWDFTNRHIPGAWYDKIAIGAVLCVGLPLVFEAMLAFFNTRTWLRDFGIGWRANAGHFLPNKIANAYSFAKSLGNARAHSFVRFVGALSIAWKAAFIFALGETYSLMRHLRFGGMDVGTHDRWELIALALLPTVAFLLVGEAKKAFGLIEDIRTFATCRFRADIYELKMDILNACAQTIVDTLAVTDIANGSPFYEEVFVFGHSMGSAIALRALIRVREAAICGAVSPDQYQRIKAFVSYGAAIEKVLSYFALPALKVSTLEAAAFFDVAETFGEGKIAWTNLYYLSDIVADRCTSYGSVCSNIRLPSPAVAWSHGHYTNDLAFWNSVLQLLWAGAVPEPKTRTWLDRFDEVVGKPDATPVFPNATSGPTILGVGLGWSILLSLFGAMYIMGHVKFPYGLYLGGLLPFFMLAFAQFLKK